MAEPTTNGAATPDQLGRFEEIVANVLSMRSDLFRKIFDPRRDIDDECGFPRTGATIPADEYKRLYDRESVAARVVEVMPKESWQTAPTVYEDEDSDTVTAFEEAWDGLGKQLRGENSWHQDEVGSPVWEHLKRADILSGIGTYGVLLIGIDDGQDLSTPAGGVEVEAPKGTPAIQPQGTDAQYDTWDTPAPAQTKKAKPGERKLLFLRAFDETLVQITQRETRRNSPRFDQPVMYSITLSNPLDAVNGSSSTSTVRVHWTRVIHIADNLGSSEVFGTPRLRHVLNNVLGLRKLYAGSPEMYWRGAFPGYSLETDPKMGGDVNIDKPAVRDGMENYMNGLQRYLLLNGLTMKAHAPQVVDPTPQINVQIEAICIQLGCPVRVFRGSERGELASSQDDAAWNDRLRERQANYLTPRVIVPFVDRLIAMGVLPEPEGYSVEWPDLASLGAVEKADIATKQTAALAQYVQSGADAVMPPMDYYTRLFGFTEKEAQAIIENADKLAEEEAADAEALAEEHGLEPMPPPGFKAPEPEVPANQPPAKGPPQPPPTGNAELTTDEAAALYRAVRLRIGA